MGNYFADGVRVAPKGSGLYTGNIDEVWNLRPLPQGGFVTAVALSAMAEELGDPGQTLRTMHTTFVAQVGSGPVDIEVDVLRRGRSMSHLRADVRNPGAAAGHVTTAVFGGPRRGYSFTDLVPPTDRPHPDTCGSFRDPPPPGVERWEPMPFWDLVIEGRPVTGHPPWEEYVPDRAERVSWYRFEDPPWRQDGSIDPFGLVVLADVMPAAVGEMVGPLGDNWFAPSVDLTVHLLDDCRSDWVLGHNRARFAGDGYASADMALWDCGPGYDEEPRLVAYATQVFFFTFL